jgi:hypothetical protein
MIRGDRDEEAEPLLRECIGDDTADSAPDAKTRTFEPYRQRYSSRRLKLADGTGAAW